MDILSHGLWGATIVRRRDMVWWALLAGMAPDILGSGGAFVYLLTIGRMWGADTWPLLPSWAKGLYHFHHSLLAAAVYFLILAIGVPRYRPLLIPYVFHVLLDAFTHSGDSIERLLYPAVLGTGLHGLNWWEHWWIMALNALALLAVNISLWMRRGRVPP